MDIFLHIERLHTIYRRVLFIRLFEPRTAYGRRVCPNPECPKWLMSFIHFIIYGSLMHCVLGSSILSFFSFSLYCSNFVGTFYDSLFLELHNTYIMPLQLHCIANGDDSEMLQISADWYKLWRRSGWAKRDKGIFLFNRK